MCGLAGIVGEVDLMEQVLLHMSAAQNHRGKETPNSWVSSFIDARVGLMHNRMKTIDMAVAPKQPFEDNDTGLVVMLDCEIFNYEVGDRLLIRGPYGNGFNLENYIGRELTVVAGGSALAPVRGIVEYVYQNPNKFNNFNLIVGFRTINDALF